MKTRIALALCAVLVASCERSAPPQKTFINARLDVPFFTISTEWHSDGSAGDVQRIHDNQAQDGDTITLPSETFLWSTGITITKAVLIQGQGIGNTVILDAVQGSPLMHITLAPGLPTRVTGIEFRDGGRAEISPVWVVFGDNTSGSTYRFDHNRSSLVKGQHDFQTVIGVVDHNEITFTYTAWARIFGTAWDGGVWGDQSISSPTNFGSSQFLFFETNDVEATTDRNFTDSYGAGRFVVRYQNMIDCGVTNHGTEGQRRRGCKAMEIYENDFFRVDAVNQILLNSRSGTLVIHNNRSHGYSVPNIHLSLHRLGGNSPIWGPADGNNQWDFNVNGQLVHALDQPGRTGGSLVTGNVPPDPPPWPSGQNDQVTEPCYSWNNTEAENGQEFDLRAGPWAREGEHYINRTPMPGYTPYTYPHPLVTGEPTPTPSPTATAIPTPSPSPCPTISPTPSPTPQPTPSPSVSPTSTVSPTPSPSATSTPTPRCVVPNFIGQRIRDAQEIWTAAGFTTQAVTGQGGGRRITFQSIPVGQVRDCHATQINVQ